MTSEEGSEELPNLTAHHHHHHLLLDWLEDSIPFLPSFLDDEPYSIPNPIADCDDWWTPQHDLNPDPLLPHPSPPGPIASSPPHPPPLLAPHHQHLLSKKRKSSDCEVQRKRKNPSSKGSSANSNSSNGSKEIRWAEQLLNPLAAAIDASNLSRVQHLLYVLQELASPSGDVNHRLASYGLRALTRCLSFVTSTPAGNGDGDATPIPTFATTEPKLFRSALIKFHEVSPWFAFPNSLANASILQTVSGDPNRQQRPKNLHIVDVGVSHGIQWPTLLEALTRRPGCAPSLVRLTIAGAALPPGPFSAAPPGYDFPSHLLRYAKSIDLNLRIDSVVGGRDLTPHSVSLAGDETLVVCVQFRAHHAGSEKRSEFFKSVRDLEPDLVVLTEIDGGGGGGGGLAAGFGKRAEMLWRFLDSTSAAFKGRESAERRVVEGEAARGLEEEEEEEESKREGREMMVGLGFREEGFGEEAVESGRALLRKYDGNWEMRAAGDAIGLAWKGQPVSFCSLWKPTPTTTSKPSE